MTDFNETWARWQAASEARAKLGKEALALNKPILFAALERAHIRLVAVTFDGAGDSGQIESLIAMDAANTEAALPDVDIAVHRAAEDLTGLKASPMPLREAIEILVYDLLEDTHDGWEINDGAYGEFRFDTDARAITLDYHERFTDETHSEHTF